jgi:hypothetical protein
MHARRALIAVSVLAVLTACGGTPSTSGNDQPKDDKSTSATVGPGTVMADTLTEAHCVRHKDGRWQANGTVKNTAEKKLSFEVRIHVGRADGKEGRAHVQRVDDLKPGKSAEWSVDKVSTDDSDGPCQIQVRVAK